MGRSVSSYRRKDPRLQPRPQVLIICEDSKSSKMYLEDVCVHFRVHVLVEVHHCGHTDPLGIVKEAIRRSAGHDRVFCVIDRDRHEHFDEAIDMAGAHPKVDVITSHPCFEIWVLLHFQPCGKPYVEEGNRSPADCLIRDLQRIRGMENYSKGSEKLFEMLTVEKFEQARTRAKHLYDAAEAMGNPNPSTQLHFLMKELEELKIT